MLPVGPESLSTTEKLPRTPNSAGKDEFNNDMTEVLREEDNDENTESNQQQQQQQQDDEEEEGGFYVNPDLKTNKPICPTRI